MSDTLEDYEALLQFLYLAPVGLIQTSSDGTVALINPLSAMLLMPLSREGNLDNLFDVLGEVAPDLRHMVDSFDKSNGIVCEESHLYINAGMGGRPVTQVISLSLYKLDSSRFMAVLNDVTLQVKRERLVRQNEVWFNAVAAGVTDYALVSLDAAGLVCEWNTTIGNLTGMTRDDVLGKDYSIFSPAQDMSSEQLQDRLHEADAGGWSLDEGWRIKSDGSRFWGSMLISPLRDPALVHETVLLFENEAVPVYSLIIRDISERREASEQHRLATACDHLTGITNRRAFFEAADREIARRKQSTRPLSLVLFDADHFKKINDTYGHPAGDAVLCHLAKLLMSTFRQVDVVARIGGEEFAVLLPFTGAQTALKIANRLREKVESEVVEFDGAQIRFTVSGGIAEMDDRTHSLEALMKLADKSLYQAKASGRNRIQLHVPDGSHGE